MEVYPFIKEGVINIFPEPDVMFLKKKGMPQSKLFIQTIYLEYEGEGEEGTNPWNSAENSLKNSQKYF
jgi:hypothetical protein